MESKALADGLIEMARRQAARPEGRERIIAALRATLAAVDGRCGGCRLQEAEFEPRAILARLSKAAEHATETLALVEAAEFLMEKCPSLI